jgi:predicted nucleotidyltransferase
LAGVGADFIGKYMRVDKREEIAGKPAIVVRNFMRRIGQSYVTIDGTMDHFKISRSAAVVLMDDLIKSGLIEIATEFADRTVVCYKTTNKGLSLSLASAAKPLLRESADRLIYDFLDRVKKINEDDNYLYAVRKVVLFGSYLSAKERINDIDVAIETFSKYGAEEFEVRAAQNIKLAEEKGKVFRTFEDRLYWPHKEVWMFLKRRCWSLSLHEMATMPPAPRQHILFENGKVYLPGPDDFAHDDNAKM